MVRQRNLQHEADKQYTQLIVIMSVPHQRLEEQYTQLIVKRVGQTSGM
jgi:hypothetical protein